MLKSPKLTIKGGLCYVFAMVFRLHFLSHFFFNFENLSAHDVANFLNFPLTFAFWMSLKVVMAVFPLNGAVIEYGSDNSPPSSPTSCKLLRLTFFRRLWRKLTLLRDERSENVPAATSVILLPSRLISCNDS